jgi:hypothetical protein
VEFLGEGGIVSAVTSQAQPSARRGPRSGRG